MTAWLGSDIAKQRYRQRPAALVWSSRSKTFQGASRFTVASDAARLLEFAELERRIAALTDRSPDPPPPFEVDPSGIDTPQRYPSIEIVGCVRSQTTRRSETTYALIDSL